MSRCHCLKQLRWPCQSPSGWSGCKMSCHLRQRRRKWRPWRSCTGALARCVLPRRRGRKFLVVPCSPLWRQQAKPSNARHCHFLSETATEPKPRTKVFWDFRHTQDTTPPHVQCIVPGKSPPWCLRSQVWLARLALHREKSESSLARAKYEEAINALGQHPTKLRQKKGLVGPFWWFWVVFDSFGWFKNPAPNDFFDDFLIWFERPWWLGWFWMVLW